MRLLPLYLILVAAAPGCGETTRPRLASAEGLTTDATRHVSEAPPTAAPKEANATELPTSVTGPRAINHVPSITAVVGYEHILQKPDDKAPLIGLIRAGQSVPLAEPQALTHGPGGANLTPCKLGWYALKPRGFVCLGPNSTLDPEDPRAVAAREVLPDIDASLPFHVGVAIGSPAYKRIPTADEQREHEKGLADYLAHVPAPDAVGAIDTSQAGHGPSDAFTRYVDMTKPGLLSDSDAYVGRKIAWVREFDAEGRTWLETPDLTLIPKDKVRGMTASSLTGIDLKKTPEMSLPLAFSWIGDAPKLKKLPDGTLQETGESYPRHSFVPVESNLVHERGGFYWVTKDGFLVHNDLFTIMKQRTDRPKGVGPHDKWVDVHITWGTLVAYEGDTPVFVTAVSPGQDGITQHSNSHNTNRGVFNVGWKLYSANMSGVDHGKEWAVDEVPFVAYYHESFALHGAFWHDEFGRPKSHGCINLSPADARWLWSWMSPQMPEG